VVPQPYARVARDYKFAKKIARAPSCTVFQGELYGHREGLVIRNLGGEEQQQQQHNGKTTPTAKNGNDFGIALESFWPLVSKIVLESIWNSYGVMGPK